MSPTASAAELLRSECETVVALFRRKIAELNALLEGATADEAESLNCRLEAVQEALEQLQLDPQGALEEILELYKSFQWIR